MTDQTDKISIYVEESQNSRCFIKKGQKVKDKKSKILFEEELRLATELISKLVNKVKKKPDENENQEDYFHQHNTIAIFGPRGVGKTSFLLSLTNYINNENEILKIKTYMASQLDPTRMETE